MIAISNGAIDTTTKCMQYFIRYNTYCKVKVMRGIILIKTVRAFGFKIKPSLITCYNFVKKFILKESLCFLQVGWNACALFVGDFFLPELTMCSSVSAVVNSGIFSRLRRTPVFSRIFYRSNY